MAGVPSSRDKGSRPCSRPVLLAAALIAAACASRIVPFDVIERGGVPGGRFPAPVYAVIADADRFRRLYGELHAGRIPPPPAPAVDFGRFVVLYAAAGDRPTAGYAVGFGKVVRSGDALVVPVTIVAPPPGGFQAAVVTRPYVLGQVAREPGVRRVRFVDAAGGALLADVGLDR